MPHPLLDSLRHLADASDPAYLAKLKAEVEKAEWIAKAASTAVAVAVAADRASARRPRLRPPTAPPTNPSSPRRSKPHKGEPCYARPTSEPALPRRE